MKQNETAQAIGLFILFSFAACYFVVKWNNRVEVNQIKRESVSTESTYHEDNSLASDKSSEQISCAGCGNPMSQNVYRIPHESGYYCQECYENFKIEAYPSGYTTGTDGKLYEKAPCGLCGGTGVEENRSTVARELGEPAARICPACKGAGHQSY